MKQRNAYAEAAKGRNGGPMKSKAQEKARSLPRQKGVEVNKCNECGVYLDIGDDSELCIDCE